MWWTKSKSFRSIFGRGGRVGFAVCGFCFVLFSEHGKCNKDFENRLSQLEISATPNDSRFVEHVKT